MRRANPGRGARFIARLRALVARPWRRAAGVPKLHASTNRLLEGTDMNATAHRLLSITCAGLLTLTMLFGIDRLAQTEAPAGLMAAAATARA